MSKKNIMLVCSAGMSTSMLVKKMQESAEEKNIDADIFAVAVSQANEELANKDLDILLLGPQVSFMKDQFLKKLEGKDIVVEVINMQDYGMMNGEKVLQTALELMES